MPLCWYRFTTYNLFLINYVRSVVDIMFNILDTMWTFRQFLIVENEGRSTPRSFCRIKWGLLLACLNVSAMTLWLQCIHFNTNIIIHVVAFTFFRCYKLSDWHFCACAINVKSSMCSETTKHFWYKCHWLFVNSPMMTTVNSCLKYRSIH